MVRLIQRDGQIERPHHGLVAQFAQGGHQRIVAQTIPAKHGARAGSDLNDIHPGQDMARNLTAENAESAKSSKHNEHPSDSFFARFAFFAVKMLR